MQGRNAGGLRPLRGQTGPVWRVWPGARVRVSIGPLLFLYFSPLFPFPRAAGWKVISAPCAPVPSHLAIDGPSLAAIQRPAHSMDVCPDRQRTLREVP